ncbi:MAG TPA: asparagine synthetase B, partial [Arcobacter skirrowii]|nr:asparagine synthetase B [Aliarcobacter skirrowii]
MKKLDTELLTIYFEGEIYNKNSFNFSDNLLLLEDFYLKYKYDFLTKLDGIFTFCIYDKRDNRYFCARDRFGNIPLYYYIKEDKFYFSTQIRDILNSLSNIPKMNKVALSKYIQYFSTFGEDTFYQDIYKLEDST